MSRPPRPLLGRRMARVNRVLTNRLTLPFAGRLPGFGVVVHVGRRTGRSFRTPVNVFADGDDFVIALTYGPEAQWVRNVMAAGGCELLTRGRLHRLVEPRLIHDEERAAVPAPVRFVLRRVRAADFLVLRRA